MAAAVVERQPTASSQPSYYGSRLTKVKGTSRVDEEKGKKTRSWIALCKRIQKLINSLAQESEMQSLVKKIKFYIFQGHWIDEFWQSH